MTDIYLYILMRAFSHAGGFFDGLFEAFDEDESDSIDETEFLRLFSVMKLQATRALIGKLEAMHD